MGGERGLDRGARPPARRRGASEAERTGRKRGVAHPPDEAFGRGRGGFSTKVHLACDGRGRPLSVLVTAGQRNEAPLLGELLDGIRVARPEGTPGRPRKRPGVTVAVEPHASILIFINKIEIKCDNFASDPSLAGMAAAGSLSPNHFSRLFKRSTGLPPHQS